MAELIKKEYRKLILDIFDKLFINPNKVCDDPFMDPFDVQIIDYFETPNQYMSFTDMIIRLSYLTIELFKEKNIELTASKIVDYWNGEFIIDDLRLQEIQNQLKGLMCFDLTPKFSGSHFFSIMCEIYLIILKYPQITMSNCANKIIKNMMNINSKLGNEKKYKNRENLVQWLKNDYKNWQPKLKSQKKTKTLYINSRIRAINKYAKNIKFRQWKKIKNKTRSIMKMLKD